MTGHGLPDHGDARREDGDRAAGARGGGDGAGRREAAGLAAGDEITVGVELDTAPREVTLPDDLAAAFDDGVRAFFDGLAPSHKKEWVRWVEESRKPETRAARVERTVESLRAGRKTR